MTYTVYNAVMEKTKICLGCCRDLSVKLFSKDKYRKDGLRYKCKECSAKEFSSYKETNNYLERLERTKQKRKDTKEVNPIKVWAHTVFHGAKARSKKLNLEFDITKEWIIQNAPTHCPLLGIELNFASDRSSWDSASIDRIDSNIGYIKSNCKIISFKANRIKSNATADELELIALNIRKYEEHYGDR